jgi:ADP-ribose pyrophosphatase
LSGFRFLDQRLVHRGAVIELYDCRFAAPDGSEFHRDVVRHPGAVSVVPVLDDGRVVLVRQYRAPLDRLMLEIPAGKRDVEGESPEQTAHRELVEEVGWAAAQLELLARFHNSVGFCDEESHVFLATGLSPAPMDRQGVEEAAMEIVTVPLADTAALVGSGEITDAKTVIGLTLARERLGGAAR